MIRIVFTVMHTIICAALAATSHSQIDSTGHHEHHRNEIGLANAPVYQASEKSLAYGIHLHLLSKIGASRWWLGGSVERIFDEHRHFTKSLTVAFQPAESVTVSASPGMVTERGNSGNGDFSLHLECVYEFELGDIHMGPMVECAYEPGGWHYAIGLHLGLGL